MKRTDTNRTRGFTLTEILVAVAIFAIIFVAALMIYDRSNRVFKESMEQSDMQQNTRVAFDNLVAEIRMAGFDFDRDGTPTGDSVYQQADEQLEYIGPHAITFRSNTNYETDAATDNGREPDYEPGSATATPDDDYIPLVTTANDEIITYALVSEDSTANTDTISFYADVARPRRTYPDAGGQSETLVQIAGVDLCDATNGCLNPPYTLYRFHLADDGSIVRSPVANNIRTMNITYFSDGLGVTEVTPNGGGGQYTVNTTSVTTTAAAYAERAVRGSVQSVAIEIIGMTEVPDADWDDPIENSLPAASQVASAKEFRQYELSTNIIPRNLGRRGMQEPSTTPPGAPQITQVCAEGCGVIRVDWNAPAFGTVDGYSIIYDTTSGTGSYGSTPVAAGTNTFGYVAGLDPATTYWFKVVASNSFGSERSINFGGPISPINYTKPLPPDLTGATGDGAIPAVDNDITIYWDISDENVAGSTESCGGPAVEVGSISEIKLNSGFEIYRSETDWAGADPIASELIWDGLVSDADGPTVLDDYTASWIDTTPKVACKTYYYKIRQKETCYNDPTHNNGGDITLSLSDFSNQISGQASATNPPAQPNQPTFLAAGCTSTTCGFNLQWDEVTTDSGGAPVLVENYTLHRFTVTGGVEDPTSEVTRTIVDANPGDGAMVTTGGFFTAAPPSGSLYHFYVSAESCGALQSVLSAPELKYPCSTMTSSGPSPGAIDGDGQSAGSPYLIANPSVSTTLTLSAPIASGQVVVYIGNTATVVTDSTSDPSLISIAGSIANVSIPLSSTNVYRMEATLTDGSGCSNTVTRYFQEALGTCCIVPFDLDGSVLSYASVSGDSVITYTVRNQCFADITLNRLKIDWATGGGGRMDDLVSIEYEDGTIDNFGGTPISVSPTTVSVPAAVTAVVPGGGTYTIVATFSRASGGTSLSSLNDTCIEYDSSAQCSIRSSASSCTIP